MGGLNLEVFKFGMYLLFPIGIMYHFGTNLDSRFAVEGFWPKPEETNKVPHSKEEIKAEYEKIVARQRVLMERRAMQEASRPEGGASTTQE
ncbi:unnamed protein product [Parascedosporium putredinis]|uniref:Mitochondrial cytochrome c oxidase assembly factor n=1 Tax=Parascedosporium putredinis TaxID=1442378 RepID=A0A9P1HBJ2_9PEZI|nr:unnamed protein product [Parascedosporium putredinis]CAI8003833.1 unnamed protein product [Parascedosporium putredinis]